MSSLTPLLAVHASAALSAVVLGPFALWARLAMTMMVLAASTALFLRSTISVQMLLPDLLMHHWIFG